tara:strand:+ start:1040 stop:1846 length:807 start_codon:yes stop_codon:yes gene_type:complete
LLGGILIFTFFSFWLRGVRLSSKNWHLFAEFNNASGLSKKTPVTYRGVLVGSIEDIIFTNELIKAKIVLNNSDFILSKPAFARVVTNSFLGGDVQVALETNEIIIPENTEKANSEKCDSNLIICQGDTITGKRLSSLSNITNTISQLLKESNQENLIENLVNSIDQFDRTQENLDELIYLSKQEILRVEPLIKEMTTAANYLNSILSAIDDKETLDDLKLTINAAKSISRKIDDMSDDFEKLTTDKELTKSIRDLTIGLSKFLNEIYP